MHSPIASLHKDWQHECQYNEWRQDRQYDAGYGESAACQLAAAPLDLNERHNSKDQAGYRR